MGWPHKLVFVRHAESVGNIRSADERAEYDAASHAYDLTPRGEKQAEITGNYLRERFGHFDVYYVSYYARARQTMKFICGDHKFYEDPRLAEAQRGIWHTMTREQVLKRFPEEIVRKEREGLYHYRPFGGENWPDVEMRVHSFLGTLNRDCDNKKVLIVCHGHWLILFQRLLEHFSIDEALRRYKEGAAENASVTIYGGTNLQGSSRLVLEENNIVPWQGKLWSVL